MTPQQMSNAWDSWITSERGESSLGPGAVGEYLRNRLWWAFMAGAEAAQNAPDVRAMEAALRRIASNDGRGGPRPNLASDPLREIASDALREAGRVSVPVGNCQPEKP